MDKEDMIYEFIAQYSSLSPEQRKSVDRLIGELLKKQEALDNV